MAVNSYMAYVKVCNLVHLNEMFNFETTAALLRLLFTRDLSNVNKANFRGEGDTRIPHLLTQ